MFESVLRRSFPVVGRTEFCSRCSQCTASRRRGPQPRSASRDPRCSAGTSSGGRVGSSPGSSGRAACGDRTGPRNWFARSRKPARRSHVGQGQDRQPTQARSIGGLSGAFFRTSGGRKAVIGGACAGTPENRVQQQNPALNAESGLIPARNRQGSLPTGRLHSAEIRSKNGEFSARNYDTGGPRGARRSV